MQLEDAGAEAGVEDRPQRFPATGAGSRARRQTPQPARDPARRLVQVPVAARARAATGLPAVQCVLQGLRQDGAEADGREPARDRLQRADLARGLGQAQVRGRVEVIEPGAVAATRCRTVRRAATVWRRRSRPRIGGLPPHAHLQRPQARLELRGLLDPDPDGHQVGQRPRPRAIEFSSSSVSVSASSRTRCRSASVRNPSRP